MWIISVLQPRVAVKTVVTINAPLALHSVPLDQIYTNQLYVWVIKYDVVICIMFHINFIFFFIHVEFFFIQIVTHYHCTAGDLELRGFWLFPLNHRKIFRGYKSFCGFSQQLTPKSKEGIFCTLFFLWNPAHRGVVTCVQRLDKDLSVSSSSKLKWIYLFYISLLKCYKSVTKNITFIYKYKSWLRRYFKVPRCMTVLWVTAPTASVGRHWQKLSKKISEKF